MAIAHCYHIGIEIAGLDIDMTEVHLAKSSSELKEYVQATASAAGKPIILVPVDFSDHSEAALVTATKLAQLIEATMVVLHVVHDPGEMPGYYSKLVKKKRATRMQDIAAEAFQDFMASIIEANPQLAALPDAERLMVIGLPVTRILEVVKHLEPMMVVMGSQGRTGLRNLIIGSKATQVMQLCPVPVTIVKKAGSREPG